MFGFSRRYVMMVSGIMLCYFFMKIIFVQCPTYNPRLSGKSPLTISPRTYVARHRNFISGKVEISYKPPMNSKLGICAHINMIIIPLILLNNYLRRTSKLMQLRVIQ